MGCGGVSSTAADGDDMWDGISVPVIKELDRDCTGDDACCGVGSTSHHDDDTSVTPTAGALPLDTTTASPPPVAVDARADVMDTRRERQRAENG